MSSLIAMKIPSNIDNGFPAQPPLKCVIVINWAIFPPHSTQSCLTKFYIKVELFLVGKKIVNTIVKLPIVPKSLSY